MDVQKLEIRRKQRAFEASGHEDWMQCRFCKQWDAPDKLTVIPQSPNRKSLSIYHLDCRKVRRRVHWAGDEATNPHTPEYLERVRASRREYYQRNKARLREIQQRSDAKHQDRVTAYNRAYYDVYKERLKDRGKEYRREQDPSILERDERRQFFRNRPLARNLFWRWSGTLSWERFKTVYEQVSNGPCDGCGKTGERMRIDHDHGTEKFRGVLCHRCNVTLGHFKDDPAKLRQLAAYLEKANADLTPKGPDGGHAHRE